MEIVPTPRCAMPLFTLTLARSCPARLASRHSKQQGGSPGETETHPSWWHCSILSTSSSAQPFERYASRTCGSANGQQAQHVTRHAGSKPNPAPLPASKTTPCKRLPCQLPCFLGTRVAEPPLPHLHPCPPQHQPCPHNILCRNRTAQPSPHLSAGVAALPLPRLRAVAAAAVVWVLRKEEEGEG